MKDQSAELQTTQNRRVVSQALEGVSKALLAAAGMVAMLMLAVWIRSATGGSADFPGRYLFALLPLVTAAWVLYVEADKLKTGSS